MGREVCEETGVTGSLDGVVSVMHKHGMRFGQGDIYVVVRLQAHTDTIVLDESELLAAVWMSREKIESLIGVQGQPLDGKVSPNNWTMIRTALEGTLIKCTELPNSRRPELPTQLYTSKLRPREPDFC